MAKFDSDLYRRYRISYPKKFFEPLRSYCRVMRGERLEVLDLGAGTGLASLSFFGLYREASFTLVDSDAGMLRVADESLIELGVDFRTHISAAEDFRTELPCDFILIGSAWHWIKPHQALGQLAECLKPGGILFIFEYQFPKVQGGDETGLAEWTRREFNLRWKVLGQKPRGSLLELTSPVRASSDFSQLKKLEWDQTEDLTRQEYLGVILSQSRYLAYENSLNEEQKCSYREQLKTQLGFTWGNSKTRRFKYFFEGYVFQRRYF